MSQRRASPPSSDASSMPDNDTEPDPTRSPTAPKKKKRTRTLTTPHQSAVLHALLAKSRFPTTAMREEVGRQIGLSARKVQIWFQNQRQKARRPQSESAPLTRPPQFGPFPIMTSPPDMSPSGPSSARSVGSLDANPPLSGPGMHVWPSSSHARRHSSAEDRDPPHRALASPLPRSPDGMSARDSRGSTRILAPQHLDSSPHFSRVLPPINLSPLEPRSSAEPTLSFPPSSSRSFMNTVQRPDPSSPAARGIPPPFALQPQPQWDPNSFTPFTRPEFASWSHPSGSARSSFSAVGAHDPPPRARYFYTSSGEPHRSSHLDPHPPSRGDRHSTFASASGRGHARSDEPAREA